LGPFGHLALKQNNIESIRLITDGACSWNLDDQCPIALSAFKHLKILSWRGLRSENDLEALIGALRQNSNQLIELELDLIRCGLANTSFGTEEDDPNNFFARDILELPPGGTKQVFSALQILSLSAVSFSSAEENIASAFDFSSLRSLKLRFCPGWENLLYHAAHSNQRIRLESLEIQSSLEDVVQDAGDVVADFLQAFVGLRELFISTGSPEPTLDLWRSLLFHKSTLRRFVHHQRCLNIDYEAGNFEGEYDLPDLSFAPEDLAKLDEDQSQNPFGDLDLECIGLCCFPKFLV
jgi:hypothetical protein